MRAKFVEYQDATRQITEHPKVPDKALKNVSIFAERLNIRLNDLSMTQSEFAKCCGYICADSQYAPQRGTI